MAEIVNYKEYPNTPKELREKFKISSATTWRKWLKPIADKIRVHAKVYQPHEVKIIVEFLEGQ